MGKTCNLSRLSPEAVIKLLHEIHPLVLYHPHIKPFNGPCSIYALSNCNTWLSTKSHVTELQSLGTLFRLLVYHIYKYYTANKTLKQKLAFWEVIETCVEQGLANCGPWPNLVLLCISVNRLVVTRGGREGGGAN